MNDLTEKNNDDFDSDEDLDIIDDNSDIDDQSDLDNEYNDEDDYDTFIPEKKPKKGLIALLILGVIIIGGGFVFFQKTPTNVKAEITKNNTAIKPTLEKTNNTTALQKIPTPPPLPTPIGPDISTKVFSTENAKNAQSTTSISATSKAIHTNNNINQQDISPDSFVTEEVLPPIITPPIGKKDNLASQQETELTTDIKNKTNKTGLDDIAQRLDSLSEKILAIENDEKTINNTNGKSKNEEVEILTQQIAQINHRLDQMTKKIETILANNIQKKPIIKKKSRKKTAIKTNVQQPKVPTKWTLKSAQPGIAWLSKGNNREIDRYSVGESLSGIGVIKSITQQNNRWVVQGTKGKVEQ